MNYDFTAPKWEGVVRRAQVKPPGKIKVRSIDDTFVSIRIKNLSEAEAKAISNAFDFIQRRLETENYRKELHVAMFATSFCTTRDSRIGVGYTSSHNVWNQPFTILNAGMFDRRIYSFEEFVITILHELFHAFESADADKTSDSEKEARHDLMCYALLGLDIPASHWAFQRYPEILAEIRGLSEGAGNP